MSDKNPTFDQVFKTRLRTIEDDAKAKGLNWTTLCKEAGVSRATPDRWRKHVPASIELVAKLETAVANFKPEAGAAAAG